MMPLDLILISHMTLSMRRCQKLVKSLQTRYLQAPDPTMALNKLSCIVVVVALMVVVLVVLGVAIFS